VKKLKVVVIGNPAVGKTSIIKRYVNDYISENYKITIGVDFSLKVLDIEGKKIHLQLWDIAGQERFGSMTRIYYKSAVGALIVFDVTQPETFESVIKWKEDLITQIKSYGKLSFDIPIILIGNKIDKIDESERELWKQKKMDDFIRQDKQPFDGNGEYEFSPRFISCELTSAKSKINISETIEYLAKYILEKESNHNELKPLPVPPRHEGSCCL